MINHKKVCWYCGSKNMEPVETRYRCRDCGATHVDVLARGSSPVTEVDAETGGSPRPRRATSFRPSAIATHQATRAREKALEDRNHGEQAVL